jgi:hypothetical protein
MGHAHRRALVKSFGRHGSEHVRVAQGISFDVKR